MRGTAGNVSDVVEGNSLLHGQETDAFGDAGYQGAHKRPDVRQDLTWHVAMRPGKRKALDKENNAIDALIEQGGAIKADGGRVYLTAKAAGDLASTVINHTGITEAHTLSTGEKGEIVLLGDMQNDRIQVAGTLDASAPKGGDGGFIETSAAHVAIDSAVKVTTAANSMVSR